MTVNMSICQTGGLLIEAFVILSEAFVILIEAFVILVETFVILSEAKDLYNKMNY